MFTTFMISYRTRLKQQRLVRINSSNLKPFYLLGVKYFFPVSAALVLVDHGNKIQALKKRYCKARLKDVDTNPFVLLGFRSSHWKSASSEDAVISWKKRRSPSYCITLFSVSCSLILVLKTKSIFPWLCQPGLFLSRSRSNQARN